MLRTIKPCSMNQAKGCGPRLRISSQMSSIRVGFPICVLSVQPAYAGSLAWQAFSARRLTQVARKNWSARLRVYSMPTGELTVGERGGLEAAMTGADTPRIRIKFLYGSRPKTPPAARRWGPCELKPMLRV